jgi:hypothetical protein
MPTVLTVTNKGGFVAHCKASWLDAGFQQQSIDNEAMTAGTNWTVTLDDGVTQLHLHVEHDTGLVWKPRNVTGDLFWDNPGAQFKGGQAQVKIKGTTLIGYGVEWENP